MSVSAPQPTQQASATAHFPDLQSLGHDIVSDLQAFTAGLARAGAPATVVQRLSQMAGVIGEVNQVLQHEQPIPNPAHNPQAAQQGQPQGQQAPQQAQPQQPAQQGGPGNQYAALAGAVKSLATHVAQGAPQQQ